VDGIGKTTLAANLMRTHVNQDRILAIEMDLQDGTLINHFGQIPRAQGTATSRTRKSAKDGGRGGGVFSASVSFQIALTVIIGHWTQWGCVYSSDVLALPETLDILGCTFYLIESIAHTLVFRRRSREGIARPS